MTRYSVMLPYHASVYVEVEAENEEDAIQKAWDDAYPSVCCHCSKHVSIDEANDDCAPSIEILED